MTTSDHIGPTIEDTSGRRGIEDRLFSLQLQIDSLNRELAQLRKQAREPAPTPAPDAVQFLHSAGTALHKIATAIEEGRRNGR